MMSESVKGKDLDLTDRNASGGDEDKENKKNPQLMNQDYADTRQPKIGEKEEKIYFSSLSSFVL